MSENNERVVRGNEQLGLTNKGISIRNLQIVIAAVTLLISVLLVVATFKTSAGFKDMQKETTDYIRLQQSSSQLQIASDYLTEQVRCFSETGEYQYMSNYFSEAKEAKSRDEALDTLSDVLDESKAVKSLEAAMQASVKLMDREYYSMRLTAEAYDMELSTFPREVRDVKLSDEDQALSRDEKEVLAREMVFDNDYHKEKADISGHMQECLSALEKSVESQETNTADRFAKLLRTQRILIIIAVLITLASLGFTLVLLVSPLLRAVVFIHADEPIPVEGSKEFRFLADTYNMIYRTNKDQKEQLEYEASHDHLTGLYNRSGFDFFMKSLDLDDTALIIIDVDKFKKVNDENGHEIGDRILIKTANVIKETFRSQDYVCRLGGDEFAIILQHVDSVSVKAVAEKIHVINEKLADTSDELPEIHVSAGVALGTNRDPNEVFREADSSMYKVKSEGGSGYDIASNATDTKDSAHVLKEK